MNDLNINCKHKQLLKKESKFDFCKKCGCFLIISYNNKVKEIQSFSILPKKIITSQDIPPNETMNSINKNLEMYSLRNFFNSTDDIPEKYRETRKVYIDMLKEYIVEYQFSTRSFFLGIYILDYIHIRYPYEDYIDKMKGELLVLGAFLIAVKFIEDDAYPPGLDTFTNKSNKSLLYSMSEVRKYEVIVSMLMEFKLDHFTSYYITETLLAHGIVFTYELQDLNLKDSKHIKEKLKKLYKLSLDINKMFVESIHSLSFNSLEIAITSIIMSKELLQFETTWNKELELFYNINADSLNNCYNAILK